MTKDSEITAVYKDTGDTPVNPGPGTNKETIDFSLRFIDMNGEIIQSGHGTVTLYEGERFTIADVATQEFRLESFTESLQYGYFEINGKRVTDPNVQIANGDMITYTQTANFPTPPVLEFEITFKSEADGEVFEERVTVSGSEIILKTLVDQYLGAFLTPAHDTYLTSIEIGYWLVNGDVAEADTVVDANDVVIFVFGSSDPGPGTDPDPDPAPEPESDTLLTPNEGQVLVKVNVGSRVMENLHTLDRTDYTLGEFFEVYFGNESGTLEDMLAAFTVTVNGEAATADTLITSQCVIAFVPMMEFPAEEPAEGEIKFTFSEIDELWATTDYYVIEEGRTLKWFYEFYQGNGTFADTLLSYEWLINGVPADADTVLTDGCVITKTFRVAEGAFSITVGETFGEETYFDRVVLEGSEITVLNLYLYINGGAPEFSFEELLAVGYWTVNGEVADADTVIRSGDEVIFGCLLTDIMAEIQEGDGNYTENIELVIPEGMTVGEFVNEYLSLNGAFEDYEWYLNGEAVAADDLLYSADGVIWLSAFRIGAETPEPGEGEIRVTLEIFNGETTRTQILIIPNTGMTLGEFFNTYLAEEWGTDFAQTLTNWSWMVDSVYTNGEAILTADSYIYAEYYDTSTLPEISVNGEVMRDDAKEPFAYAIGSDTLTLYDFFYYHLYSYQLVDGTHIEDWEWTVDGTVVTDYLFMLYDGAYVSLKYIGEDEGGDIPGDGGCDHNWDASTGTCYECGEPCPEDHSGLLLGESCRNCTWMINDGKFYIINVTVEDAGRTERLEYVTDTLTLDTIAADLGIHARDYIWYLASREIEYAEGKTLYDYSVYYYGDVELRLCERYVAFGYYVLNEFNESVIEWTGYETSGLKFHGSITFGELLGYAKDMGIEDVNAYHWKFYSYSGEEFYLDPAQDADYVFDSHDSAWEVMERAALYDVELSPKNSFGVRLYVYDSQNYLVDEKSIVMTEAKQLYTFLSDLGYSYWNCTLVEVRYPNQYEPIYSTEYTYVNQRYDITIYLADKEVTEEGAEAA